MISGSNLEELYEIQVKNFYTKMHNDKKREEPKSHTSQKTTSTNDQLDFSKK